MCDDDGPAAELRLELLDSAGTSDDDPASSSFLLVLGLFKGRSGLGVGSRSEGDVVADFRFLLLGLGSIWICFAFSKAFQARISSCDSGSSGSGRSRGVRMSRRVDAASRNLFAAPCLSAT